MPKTAQKDDKPYENLEVEEKDEGVVEITGQIKADVLKQYKERVLKEIQKDFETEGFRKGKAPLNLIEDKLGEEHILNEAAREALNAVYPSIVREEDLDIMSRPRVNITKLAIGSPLGFKIHVGIAPEVDLPAYKDIAKSVRQEQEEESEDVEVSDQEVDQVIKYIQAQQAQESEDGDTPKTPELTDESVKQMGDFENVEDFKKKMKENLKREKQTVAKREMREKITNRLVEEADFEIPDVTVESELQNRMEQLMQSLDQRDSSLEEYLEKIDKSEEEFVEEERETLKKQIKARLIIEKIAEEEGVEADEEQVKQRLKAMQQYQPDADPRDLREYIEKSLKNQKVIEMLESDE